MKVKLREYIVVSGSAILFRSPFKKAAKVFQVCFGSGEIGKLVVTKNLITVYPQTLSQTLPSGTDGCL